MNPKIQSLNQDYKEFIELLHSHQIEHLIVGGIAFGFHAHPRYTKDIDIWIKRDQKTAKKLLLALAEFGFIDTKPPFKAADSTKAGQIIQLGSEPVRIDILTSLSGVAFEAAWQKQEEITLDGTKLYFIDRESLIKAKLNAGRPQDLADVEKLKITTPSSKKP